MTLLEVAILGGYRVLPESVEQILEFESNEQLQNDSSRRSLMRGQGILMSLEKLMKRQQNKGLVEWMLEKESEQMEYV